jgi:predicted methyltransferase
MLRRALAAALAFCCIAAAAPADPPDRLAALIAGPQRTDKNRVRDRYRHPLEVLTFFGIRDDMTVLEVAPGGAGWWTEILAPYLAERGRYYVALPPGEGAGNKAFRAKIAADPKTYGKVMLATFPGSADIIPPRSADLVLTFRNLHDWLRDGTAEAAFRSFFLALKRGGVLGLVDHRADPTKPDDPKAASGYVNEAYAIRLAEAAGFKLAARSEVNANPADTKDYPEGVWTLPPTLRLGERDRAKYLAIGESDRFTLKFIKP